MKRQVINRILLLIAFTGIHNLTTAQNKHSANFIGLNPSVTIEPYYDKGEIDINIFPLVYQKPFSKKLDFRLTSVVNYGIRTTGNALSILGLDIGLPFYIKSREDKTSPSKEIFVAPILSLTRNRLEDISNIGLWIEPGYSFLFSRNFAMSLGLQFGATHFSYNDGQTEWSSHFGVRVIAGKWF